MFALSAIVVITLASAAYGQDDGGITVFDNKAQCIKSLVEWCNNMKYPQEGAGMAILSVTLSDSKDTWRIFCSSDSDGTNCTKNGNSWFYCSPDNKLTYKGKYLTKDSTEVDDDICNTADQAFNTLFIQNLSYGNTTLKKEVEKGMESFFEEMAAMQEQITAINDFLKKLSISINPPDNGFSWNTLYRFGRGDWITDSPNVTQLSTNSPNQIEKE